MQYGASAYFDRKVLDFFADAEARFDGDDLSVKSFVWCQGEGERSRSYEEYKLRLAVLWEHMRGLGFTHFFCIRVGYWGGSGQNNLDEIMRAQEDFCQETDNCYIVTRALSLMARKEIDGTDWFAEAPSEEYLECRDSYFGFKNHHVNEKGFGLIAERMADNLERLLYEGKAPLLEKENVSKLIGWTWLRFYEISKGNFCHLSFSPQPLYRSCEGWGKGRGGACKKYGALSRAFSRGLYCLSCRFR